MKRVTSGLMIASALLLSGPVGAQTRDVRALLEAGLIGEQADGYLGAVGKADANTSALLKAANAQRAKIYAMKTRSVAPSLAETIRILTCDRFKNGMTYNTSYKSSDGVWRTFRAGGPAVVLPTGCR